MVASTQNGVAMSFVQVGDCVRIYYEPNCFDEGKVISVVGHLVTVDFLDWVEEFTDDTFKILDLFYEGIEVLVPVRRGKIVLRYGR
jgi:hypothetical protein